MAVVTVAVVTVAVGPACRQRADDRLSCALASAIWSPWTFQPCWSVCMCPPVCKSQVTAQPTVAVAARYVRAWLESLCGSLLAWESAAGPCHTIISKAELTGRAAPSDLLGAPFNYITMAVMATVRCRPPGASQRFRAVLVRLRAARASGRLCAARRGARQGASGRLGSAFDHRGGSLCASTEAPAPMRISPVPGSGWHPQDSSI